MKPTLFESYNRLKAKAAKLEEELKTAKRRVKGAEFWSKFVYPEGAKATDIQNELMDYHDMLGEVRQVYMHITMGNIAKPNTCARDVIAEADRVSERAVQDALKKYQEFVGEDDEEWVG